MSSPAPRSARSDATRNRSRLIAAARAVFAAQGPEAPLEEIARAAAVSRTTLYRNFATREELAATVFEDNVAEIERRAAEAPDDPAAVVDLFHVVLSMQLDNPALARTLSRADQPRFIELAGRTAAAFEPLVQRGRQEGVVHDDVSVDDVMRAFPMAAAALVEDDIAGRSRSGERVRGMLHRALFTTAPR
jgi:AcrR family transcriptional regulator